MRQQIRSLIVGGYLLLCILLGGSAQGIWTNLALQLLGIALIAWAALAGEPATEERSPPPLYFVLGLAGVVVLLQLIPIPAGIWTDLPGRSELASGLELAGEPQVAQPISQTPYRSVMALFAVIPPLALFIAVKVLRPSPRWLAFAIVTGMTLSIGLGAIQVAAGRTSSAYLYPITNPGAVGVFANLNHMGTLLVVSIPFATALIVSWKGVHGGSEQARWALGISMLLLLIIGIALNGSRAALGLAVPVLMASAALVRSGVRWPAIALATAPIALLGGVILLASAPIATEFSESGPDASVETREKIWSTTTIAIRDTFPVGTGLGSFERVYRQYENPAEVTTKFVNHAHNDYLELVLELGAAGVILIVLFLGWWAITATRIWISPLSTAFERGATIASAAILAHSIVDYPLRTAAISAIFAVTIALMAQPLRSTEAASAGEGRPARHIKLG